MRRKQLQWSSTSWSCPGIVGCQVAKQKANMANFYATFEWFPIHFCGIRCGCVWSANWELILHTIVLLICAWLDKPWYRAAEVMCSIPHLPNAGTAVHSNKWHQVARNPAFFMKVNQPISSTAELHVHCEIQQLAARNHCTVAILQAELQTFQVERLLYVVSAANPVCHSLGSHQTDPVSRISKELKRYCSSHSGYSVAVVWLMLISSLKANLGAHYQALSCRDVSVAPPSFLLTVLTTTQKDFKTSQQ